MVRDVLNSIMCGIYISLGATVFLLAQNDIAGAILFTIGIFLVITYRNMLLTGVFPLFVLGDYKTYHIALAFFGNAVGAFIYASMLSITRLSDKLDERIASIVQVKMGDTFIGLFILAIFCGFLVASACLTSRTFHDNRMVSVFLTVFFIAGFVICGFDHIVANFFYFSFFFFKNGFNINMLFATLAVFLGNAVGGLGAGLLHKFREPIKKI